MERKQRIFRIKYRDAAGVPHVYARLFVAEGPDATFAAIGSLTMRKAEWGDFKFLIGFGSGGDNARVEFIDDLCEPASGK